MATKNDNTVLAAQQEYRTELEGFIQDWQTLKADLAEMRSLVQMLNAPAAQRQTPKAN